MYTVRHNEVGGVTNGKFCVEVRSVLGIELSRLPASHVAGVLGEALEDLTSGHAVDLPTSGELNSFRGILSWAQQKQAVVVVKCVSSGQGGETKS